MELRQGAKHLSSDALACIEAVLVALPGLEPGLFALRGRRVNQLHHNAKMIAGKEEILSRSSLKYSCFPIPTQGAHLALKPQLLYLIVVILSVKNVPLLGSFHYDLPLRSNLLPCRCIDLGLLGQ